MEDLNIANWVCLVTAESILAWLPAIAANSHLVDVDRDSMNKSMPARF